MSLFVASIPLSVNIQVQNFAPDLTGRGHSIIYGICTIVGFLKLKRKFGFWSICLKHFGKEFIKLYHRDVPGGLVVKILPSSAEGADLITGQGTEIPRASWSKNQNIKWKQYCNK